MNLPVRLQLSRRKHFSLQLLSRATNGLPAVSVARPGRWGNPHVALRTWYHGGYPALGLPAFDAVTAQDADREGAHIAVALFRHEAERRPQVLRRAARQKPRLLVPAGRALPRRRADRNRQ